MRTTFGDLIFGLTCFIIGMVVMSNLDRTGGLRPGPARQAAQPGSVDLMAPQTPVVVDFTNQLLWAYGFERRPEPGERAQPQAPPNRRLRPNEPEEEQTRTRTLEGSTASYSFLDVRDGQHVIDWHVRVQLRRWRGADQQRRLHHL